jgi:hypothetical protein
MLWVTYADDINLYPCVRNKSVNRVEAATPANGSFYMFEPFLIIFVELITIYLFFYIDL